MKTEQILQKKGDEKMAKYHKITYKERQILEKLLAQDIPKTKIAKMLDITRTNLYYELNRCKGTYNADEAQKTL